MTADGQHRLNNGSLYTVGGFAENGNIFLKENKWEVSNDFGHFTYGYVVTSHASQGKSVKNVFIGQASQSFGASSKEQFYVSVSRGEQSATIYTDDKQSLLEAVQQSDDRVSALELVKQTIRSIPLHSREQRSQDKARWQDATKEPCMADSILERLNMRRELGESVLFDESEALDDLGAFGWHRGVKERAIMLELRKRDGNVIALSYAWLERVTFDPSIGLVLDFSRALVRIKGTNLDYEIRPNCQLFAGIVRHKVPWIMENRDFSTKNLVSLSIQSIDVS